LPPSYFRFLPFCWSLSSFSQVFEKLRAEGSRLLPFFPLERANLTPLFWQVMSYSREARSLFFCPYFVKSLHRSFPEFFLDFLPQEPTTTSVLLQGSFLSPPFFPAVSGCRFFSPGRPMPFYCDLKRSFLGTAVVGF